MTVTTVTTVWMVRDGWSVAHEFARLLPGGRRAFCGQLRRRGLSVASPRSPLCRRCLASRRHRAHAAPYATVPLPPFAEVS